MPEIPAHTRIKTDTADTGHHRSAPPGIDHDQDLQQRPQEAVTDRSAHSDPHVQAGRRRSARALPSASMRAVTEVRTVLADILANLNDAGINAAPVVLTRHRKPMAVLISAQQFYEYCDLVATQVAQGGKAAGPDSAAV
jgi:hypothetical protein